MSKKRKIHVPEVNHDGEVVLELANGYSIRSGSEDLTSGTWVRIVSPDNDEVGYWDYQEWQDEPELVMGAIINAAITAADDNRKEDD